MSDETVMHSFQRALDEVEQGVRQSHERPPVPLVEELSSGTQEAPATPGDLPGWLMHLDAKLEYLINRLGQVERFLGIDGT